MGWHLRQLDTVCWQDGCSRTATQELYNAANAPTGRYCDRHANVRLAEVRALYPD